MLVVLELSGSSSISIRHRGSELFGGPVAVPGRPQRRWRIGESGRAPVVCGSGCRICRQGTSRQWSAHARHHHIHRRQSYSGHGAGGFQKMERPDATVTDVVDILLCTTLLVLTASLSVAYTCLLLNIRKDREPRTFFVVKSRNKIERNENWKTPCSSKNVDFDFMKQSLFWNSTITVQVS